MPELVTGLGAGTAGQVEPHGQMPVPRSAPFLSDIPAGDALAAWLEGVTRVDAVEVALADVPLALHRAAPESWASAFVARVRRLRDGRHRRARVHTPGATETLPALARYTVVDTGDALPDGCDAVVMREHVHWADGVPEVRAAAAAAARAHDRRGGQRHRAAAPRGAPPAPGRRRGRRGRRPRRARCPARAARGRSRPATRCGRSATTPHWVSSSTRNSLMLGAQAREVGCTVESLPVLPDDSARGSGAAVADAAGRADR